MEDSSLNELRSLIVGDSENEVPKDLSEINNLIMDSGSESTDQLDELKSLFVSQDPVTDKFNRLQDLLFGEEKDRLAEFAERFEDPETHAAMISKVLPDAISLSSREKDAELSKSLYHTIEHTLNESVEKNPEILTNILFPLMGPAIRKAISQSFKELIQSMNQMLESSFSIKGIKWRLEAMRSKKPFAEVVLLNSLVFRVEQLFLIHKDSGLLLQHISDSSVEAQDPDLVSAMLTAIQDFIFDSFGEKKFQELETLEIGELTVWVEQGSHAVLAGVIRGNPPLELRQIFKETLERIHKIKKKELTEFQGDPLNFEDIRDDLKDCLQIQLNLSEKKNSPLIFIIPIFLLLIISFIIFNRYSTYNNYQQFLSILNQTEGIIVTDYKYQHNDLTVHGLLDPLAPKPEKFLHEMQISDKNVKSNWEPFYSLKPGFILIRAKKMLLPPPGVSLNYNNETLFASGEASFEWIEKSQEIATYIPGVKNFDFTSLDDRSIEFLKQKINEERVYFDKGSIKLGESHQETIIRLSQYLHKLDTFAVAKGLNIHIKLTGHSDSSGSDNFNLKISQLRSDNVLNLLKMKGFNKLSFISTGVGANHPFANDSQNELSRSVSLQVEIIN